MLDTNKKITAVFLSLNIITEKIVSNMVKCRVMVMIVPNGHNSVFDGVYHSFAASAEVGGTHPSLF